MSSESRISCSHPVEAVSKDDFQGLGKADKEADDQTDRAGSPDIPDEDLSGSEDLEPEDTDATPTTTTNYKDG